MRTFPPKVVAALRLLCLFPFLASAAAQATSSIHSTDHADDMPRHGATTPQRPSEDSLASSETYHGQGTVQRLADHQVAIAHQAIPALHWPPMTMTFTVPQSLKAPTLAAGMPVAFSFRRQPQGYTITDIQIIRL